MDNIRCWFLLFTALVLAIALNPPAYSATTKVTKVYSDLDVIAAAQLTADLRHKFPVPSTSRYSKVVSSIPVSKIRNIAVSAAKKGRVHPGFIAATVAAGFLFDNDTGEVVKEVEEMPPAPEGDVDPVSPSGSGSSGSSDPRTGEELCEQYGSGTYCTYEPKTNGGVNYSHWSCPSGSYGVEAWDYRQKCYLNDTPEPEPITTTEPVSDQELEELDNHINGDLLEQIANDPNSDWHSNTPSWASSDFALPSEAWDNILKDQENAEAQANGEEEPHPDQDTDTQTADDQLVEEIQDLKDELTEEPKEGDLPPEPDAEWEVNEYDSITPEEVNVGSGSCPAPYVIDLVGDLPPVEITFDYICDFADYVRWFFLAGAWILAGTIVIRE